MKKMAVLLFTDIEHDSRVQRTVSALSKIFDIDIFCRDNKTHMNNLNLKFYHNRYSDNDADIFQSSDILPIKFIKKLIYYIDTEKMKFRSIIDFQYDLYYCNDFNTLISGFIASRKKRAKLVYDSHELWSERSGARNTLFNRIKRLFELIIEKSIIMKCDAVITVSKDLSDAISGKFSVHNPIVIRNIPLKQNLPNPQRIDSIRKSLNIPPDSIVVLYQGSTARSRGIAELIMAADLMPENIHILLLGPQPEVPLMNDINSRERVHYGGYIHLDELDDFTAACDIGIAPIIKDNTKSYELAFPNKFLQYMNAGLALCLYDIPEARRLIEKCECGSIIQSITPQGIAKSIEYLGNKSNLLQMKINARKYFSESFSYTEEMNMLIKVMRKL